MLASGEYVHPDLGKAVVAADGEAIVGLWLEGQKYFAGSAGEPLVPDTSDPLIREALAWLAAYFAGRRPDPRGLPLAPRGGEFRQRVWRRLLEIPYGQVATYGQIARELAEESGGRMSAQAVGGAVGHNPISIIVPCHRVVGSSGSLTGYAGGIAKKVWLLEHEGADMARLFVPKRGTAL